MSKEIFPFRYQGGGYFRRIGVPIGKQAEVLHGQEAIKYLLKKFKEIQENEKQENRKAENCL